jgi:hypothetical protein
MSQADSRTEQAAKRKRWRMVLILAGLVTSRYQAANGYATFGRYLVTITPPLRGSALTPSMCVNVFQGRGVVFCQAIRYCKASWIPKLA